ncbi:MAG: D-beta-D-heptose 1-phosphate adenosyltransferase [Pelodictyon luteolum]|uniref:D-glycero-beta-D-manno-heptose 1-phosphate adenylyltransferase n=1 Tax=Pelodictyon luteolum TaxID=1100 RepID=A0A165MJB2_PELLU|nr:D-glycero-beta-D-manno-heptose 1-phosphate adenylyltransferase [Pelodictyon luteolum]KZK75314.1 MAG: D-beta-D-heptose 1-phosphate adenosyltransferase [Pelodictyon luteolum]
MGDYKAKLLTRLDARDQVKEWQREGLRVVFTNGCFDILHAGHVGYLTESRRLGDRLIIGLNSDASVQRIKGPLRPVCSEEDRAAVLSALRAVDAVTLFDEDTPEELIGLLLPDILVKGADWAVENIAGAKAVLAQGGSVLNVPLLEGRSTTGIIERIVAAYAGERQLTARGGGDRGGTP